MYSAHCLRPYTHARRWSAGNWYDASTTSVAQRHVIYSDHSWLYTQRHLRRRQWTVCFLNPQCSLLSDADTHDRISPQCIQYCKGCGLCFHWINWCTSSVIVRLNLLYSTVWWHRLPLVICISVYRIVCVCVLFVSFFMGHVAWLK